MNAALQLVDKETGEITAQVDAFSDFWLLYPKRVAKLDARKAWAKIPQRHHIAILAALVNWRRVWKDKELEYLPHPATWLRGERWDDELPPEYTQTHSSHVPVAAAADVQSRTEMPENVRALLAKLKAQRA